MFMPVHRHCTDLRSPAQAVGLPARAIADSPHRPIGCTDSQLLAIEWRSIAMSVREGCGKSAAGSMGLPVGIAQKCRFGKKRGAFAGARVSA